MSYPMWDSANRGILVDRGEGVLAYLESGPEFEALKRTAEAWHEWPVSRKTVTAEMVNAERDRRLADDFEFQGKLYQRDPTSLQRITGAATLAGFAIAAGKQAGDLRWANPDQDFGWIASDNTITPMDAQTCFAFGQAAAAVETRLIFRAKELRLMQHIPADYTDDSWWQ